MVCGIASVSRLTSVVFSVSIVFMLAVSSSTSLALILSKIPPNVCPTNQRNTNSDTLLLDSLSKSSIRAAIFILLKHTRGIMGLVPVSDS